MENQERILAEMITSADAGPRAHMDAVADRAKAGEAEQVVKAALRAVEELATVPYDALPRPLPPNVAILRGLQRVKAALAGADAAQEEVCSAVAALQRIIAEVTLGHDRDALDFFTVTPEWTPPF
jgi:hypothetical protein